MNALPYYGGKVKRGPWVNSHLPHRSGYVEPYAGMLGVLLSRPPAKTEIVNDINDHIVNWWRCMRDATDELERLVSLTPRSRTEFRDSQKMLAEGRGTKMERALAMHVVLAQGINARTDGNGSWAYRLSSRVSNPWVPSKFAQIAKRMAEVQLENKDALKVLEFTASVDDVVVYCDPPYHTAARRYAENEVPIDALTDALLSQRGCVAISGYRDEWDHLGWRVEEVPASCTIYGSAGKSNRTERLWMNYPPEAAGRNGDLFT